MYLFIYFKLSLFISRYLEVPPAASQALFADFNKPNSVTVDSPFF